MSASPAPKPEAPQTLPALAREALAAHDGNVAAAVTALTSTLRSDVRLLRALVQGVVQDAVSYRVEMTLRDRRKAIVRAASSGQGRASVVALANGISSALLDMPLAGGTRLRHATREQVLDQAQRYHAQASDMAHKARWLTMIARAVDANQVVGEIITEARANELWQEAGK